MIGVGESAVGGRGGLNQFYLRENRLLIIISIIS